MKQYGKHHDFMKNIGESCKRWRVKNHYTRSEIAERMGITITYLYEFERGNADSGYIVASYVKMGCEL